MICDKCGAKLDDNAEFCLACGNKISKKAENSTDDSLLNKYKNNISFFSLSDDSVNKQSSSDEQVSNPFVFPNNIFNETLNDNSVGQEESVVDDLFDSPIFPDNISDTENTGVNLGQTNTPQSFENAPIFPTNVANSGNTDINLGQADNVQTFENVPIFPTNVSNSENTDINLGQADNVQTFENVPIFPTNVSNSENTDINLGQVDSVQTFENNPIFPTNVSNNTLIDAPIFPENSVKNSELTSNVPTDEHPLQVNTETVNSGINNDTTLDDSVSISNEKKASEVNNSYDVKKGKKKSSNSLIVFVALVFIVFIVLAIFLTGNDLKKVSCVQTETDNGLTSETTLNATFRNNKIKNLTISGNYVVADAYISYIDNFYESVKEELNKYSSLKGTEVTTNIDNNTIIYNVTSTDSKSLFRASLGKNSETSQDFTCAAEEQGYKCNINEN